MIYSFYVNGKEVIQFETESDSFTSKDGCALLQCQIKWTKVPNIQEINFLETQCDWTRFIDYLEHSFPSVVHRLLRAHKAITFESILDSLRAKQEQLFIVLLNLLAMNTIQVNVNYQYQGYIDRIQYGAWDTVTLALNFTQEKGNKICT